jgi:hypothetical protein
MESFGHSCQHVGFLQVSGQRFLAYNSLDFGPALDCLGYVAHDVDANKIRGKNTDHVNSGTKIANALEHPCITQSVPLCALGESFGSRGGTNSRQFDVTDRTQRSFVKAGYETCSNHPYFQHGRIPFISNFARPITNLVGGHPNATNGARVGLLSTLLPAETQLKKLRAES